MNDDSIIDFSVGTDVEFFMTDQNGRLIHSNEYFDDDSGKMSMDANGRNFEIRSKPSKDPIEVIIDIQKTMQDTVNEIPEFYNFRWVGNSFFAKLAAGTHFHFGVKKLLDPKIACNYLDNYMGLISLLLEDRQCGINRRKYNKTPQGNDCSYGKMSDFRLKRWGYEYRPISTNIQSPYILLAFLCLGKALIFEALNNKSFTPSKYIEPIDFIEMNTSKLRCLFPSIWSEIKRLKLYPKYQKYLELIPHLIKNNLSWLVPRNGDFKHNWGIINPNLKNPNVMTLDTIWKDFEKQKNIWRVIEEPIKQNQPEPILDFGDFYRKIERIQKVRFKKPRNFDKYKVIDKLGGNIE